MRCRVFTLLLHLLLMTVGCAGQCHQSCVCSGHAVRCTNAGLIPSIPPATKMLNMIANKLTGITRSDFAGAGSLETLFLQDNSIEVIRAGTFRDCLNLIDLYLYRNDIRLIESGAFQGLERVKRIYLNENRLSSLSPSTFHGLPDLHSIYLHENKIAIIPEDSFGELPNLANLRLHGNPLVCNCSISWLLNLIKSNELEVTGKCVAPRQFVRAPLEALPYLQCDDIPEFVTELSVELPPRILSGPQSAEVAPGATTYLYCVLEEGSSARIIWTKDSEILEQTNELEERRIPQPDGSLMILNFRSEDSGSYTCTATSNGGTVTSQPAVLTLADERTPTLIRAPYNYTAHVGENVQMPCEASGQPTPRTAWLHNDNAIALSHRIRHVSNVGIAIESAELTDSGIYQCIAFNQHGKITHTAILNVEGPPEFIQRPANNSVREGVPVVFRCSAEQDITNIIWKKNGFPIHTNDQHVVLDHGSGLQISSVTAGDEGRYTCELTNTYGTLRSHAFLVVQRAGPPVFTQTPIDTFAIRGTDAVIHCRAESPGDEFTIITWTKDSGLRLTFWDRFSKSSEGDLHISQVAVEDAGRYECTAQNARGRVQASARLIVEQRQLPGDTFVSGALETALNEVDREILRTVTALRHTPRTPSEILQALRYPSGDVRAAARAAEVMDRTIQIVRRQVQTGEQFTGILADPELVPLSELISTDHLRLIANFSGCEPLRYTTNCTYLCEHRRYRTINGTCNNLKNSLWGASNTPFRRLLPANYENGFNTPPGYDSSRLYNGYRLPSARQVTNHVIRTSEVRPDGRLSSMLMQWGQFLDHDIDLAPLTVSHYSFSTGQRCNDTCNNEPPCFPIPIPEDDPRVRHHRCLGVTRSAAVCGTGVSSPIYGRFLMREQVNQITAFIDANNVYGSSSAQSDGLRARRGGRLRVGARAGSTDKFLLPFNVGEPIDCQVDASRSHIPCFQAGDARANEQLGLLVMHTIWFRQHNKLARRLEQLNPKWTDETLYQETRKIVGAQMQHITYSHWLPLLLGRQNYQRLIGPYNGYDSDLDPSVSNSFATAAYRMGHALVNPLIYRYDENMRTIQAGNLALHEAFFAPWRLVEEGGVDPILRGLFGSAASGLPEEGALNSELTERLFRLAHTVALDLSSLNIQRGRDHGLPFYNDFRRHCGLSNITTWRDLNDVISSSATRAKLQELYRHPGNIDLWVGGILERPVEGARVGPTFMCIITDQFKRLRAGDRLWYEKAGVFSPDQLAEIKLTSLGRVMCDNGDNITHVSRDPFVTSRFPRDHVDCSELPEVDLKPWASCCYDCGDGIPPHSVEGDTPHTSSRRRRSVTNRRSRRPRDDVDQLEQVMMARLDSLEQQISQLQRTNNRLVEQMKKYVGQEQLQDIIDEI